MKTLKKQFVGTGEVKGFNFTQIRYTNRAFLYEVNTGYSLYYEVFKKVLNKRFKVVSYPTSKCFGVWAWTYSTLEEALIKFDLLNQISKGKPVITMNKTN
jgi:hypothetical protein